RISDGAAAPRRRSGRNLAVDAPVARCRRVVALATRRSGLALLRTGGRLPVDPQRSAPRHGRAAVVARLVSRLALAGPADACRRLARRRRRAEALSLAARG